MKKTKLIMISFMLALILAACDDTWKPQESITGEETIKEDGDSLRTNENTPTQVPTSTITPTLTPTIPPLSKEQLLAMTYSEVADYIRLTALSDEMTALRVMVYDNELWEGGLLGKSCSYHIGKDFGVTETHSNDISSIRGVLIRYPGTVLRKMPEDMYYMAFESESGDRVYYFASEKTELRTMIGLPVLICGELKKYSDFAGITLGCTLDDVLMVDSTVEEYYDFYYHIQTPNEGNLWAGTKALRYTTVHYLEDGILVFGYGALNESGKLVITEIKYSPEYTLTDCRGRDIVYKINPLDLPSVE